MIFVFVYFKVGPNLKYNRFFDYFFLDNVKYQSVNNKYTERNSCGNYIFDNSVI